MTKKINIDSSLLKLALSKNVAAVDPHNKIVYLKYESREDMFKFMEHGYKVYTVGKIQFVGDDAGRFVMPIGCSPAHIEDKNTAVTALHCISDADMRPHNTASLVVVDGSLPELYKVEASLKSYTPVKKCGMWCRLMLFFRKLPESYINFREIAWLEAPANLSKYEPLPELEVVGFLTAGNTEGDYMMFSPLPGKEDKIRPGTRIAYISFNYRKNQIELIETAVAGYAVAFINRFIFYLPYAYEPGRTLAIPGFSGSAIKLMYINSPPDVHNE